MNLQEFMDAVDCRVCGGSEFQWECYPNAHYMDISDINGKDVCSCLFSTTSQEVYEVTVYLYDSFAAYRWIDPVYAPAHAAESEMRGVDTTLASDDLKFIDIASEEDILKTARSIIHLTYVHSHPLTEEQQQ